MRVEWSERALDRVDEIVAFISAHDVDAANRWATELFAAVEGLTDFPRSGRVVPEIEDPAIREILHGAYRSAVGLRAWAAMMVEHARTLRRTYEPRD